MESTTNTPNGKAKAGAKDGAKEIGLSQAQVRLLSLAWQCIKDGSEPQVRSSYTSRNKLLQLVLTCA